MATDHARRQNKSNAKANEQWHYTKPPRGAIITQEMVDKAKEEYFKRTGIKL